MEENFIPVSFSYENQICKWILVEYDIKSEGYSSEFCSNKFFLFANKTSKIPSIKYHLENDRRWVELFQIFSSFLIIPFGLNTLKSNV